MIPTRDIPATFKRAREEGYREIASGAFRRAFVHPDRPDRILKIAKRSSNHYLRGIPCNQKEIRRWEEAKDGPFAHLFTPILAKSPDDRAILMRRECYVWHDTYDDVPGDPGPEYWRIYDAVEDSMRGPLHQYETGLPDGLWPADIHPGNVTAIPDDYGTLVYTRALDYG